MEPKQFVIGRNVAKQNKHWYYCKRHQIPYVKVYRSRYYSTIGWDFWTIDVAFLGLNKESSEKLDAYIEGLFQAGKCREATLHTTETGFFKVRRNLEEEALRFLLEIISNPKTWSVKEKSKFGLEG